jgi:hypothetical protein
MKQVVRAVLTLAAVLFCGVSAPTALVAQSLDHAVGTTAGSHMHALLQKTLLKVDVLTVDICFDEPTARRLAAIANRGRLRGAAADSMMRAVLAGRLALARVGFLRDIPVRDFLQGVDEDLRNAVAAGVLADSVYRAVSAGLPAWYAPLQRRGIRTGDVLVYEMQPNAVRTVYRNREGRVLLERTDSGRAKRNSPLAAWLAKGAPVRDELLQSLQPAAGASGASGGRAGGCAAGMK